jgi:hypothetical protein
MSGTEAWYPTDINGYLYGHTTIANAIVKVEDV